MKKDDEPALLEHPIIQEIATAHDASTAQVLIAWALERDTSVIPKSVNPGRLQQNLDATRLSLTSDDMSQIATIDKGYRFVDGRFFEREGGPYMADGIWV